MGISPYLMTPLLKTQRFQFTPDQHSGSTDQSDENGSLINIDTQHESDPHEGKKVISSKEANASNIALKMITYQRQEILD